MGTITIHSKKLYTLNPDGSEYKELSYPTQWTKNRIGEYKKIVLECSSTQNLANTIIYFNPALYMNGAATPFTSGAVPNEGYSYVVDPAATMGDYDMAPFVNIGYAIDLFKNWEVEIHIGYGNDFRITFKYFQDQDRLAFLGTASQFNHDKLLKDKVGNPTELVVSGRSVYSHPDCIPRVYICQVDTVDASIKSFITSSFDSYKAGFYHKNEHGTTPYYSNPVWDVNTADGKLSKTYDTIVEFSIDGPIVPFKWMVWMIRTDKVDNTVDFYENYEASFATIVDNGGTSTIDNKIKAPSVFLALDSGSTYKGSFSVDKSLITDGASYRFIAVVYATESNEVNSFISDVVNPASPSFDGVGYTFAGKLRDYFNDYYGNKLTCTIEERIQSIINVNYTYFGFTSDIQARLGLMVPNDIRRYLTKVTVEIYDTPSSQLKNVYDRAIAYKMDPVTYSVPPNMELNFTTDNVECKYLFRNRYEADVPNMESYFNGVLIPPATTQDWGGKTLKIKTTMELYYDDYVVPFTDALEFDQEITVKDYATQQFFIYKTGTQQSPRSIEYYCSEEDICLDAYLASGAYAGYRLLTTIEKDPGNIATIEENEELTGVLTQLDSDIFYDQEQAFGETVANRAKFCLDPAEMFFDVPYKVCAIAKKLTI